MLGDAVMAAYGIGMSAASIMQMIQGVGLAAGGAITSYIKSTMSPQDPADPMLQAIYKIAYDKINDLYTMTGTIAIVKK